MFTYFFNDIDTLCWMGFNSSRAFWYIYFELSWTSSCNNLGPTAKTQHKLLRVYERPRESVKDERIYVFYQILFIYIDVYFRQGRPWHPVSHLPLDFFNIQFIVLETKWMKWKPENEERNTTTTYIVGTFYSHVTTYIVGTFYSHVTTYICMKRTDCNVTSELVWLISTLILFS